MPDPTSDQPVEPLAAAPEAAPADLAHGAVTSRKKPRGLPFEPGISGNPAGRPKGSRNRTTIWRERFRTGDVAAATQAVLEAARRGDMSALRIILQPLLRKPRSRVQEYQLPPLRTLQDVADAMDGVLADISAGELTIEEGEKLTRILERRVLILRAQGATGPATGNTRQ